MGFQNRTVFLLVLMCAALAARFLPHPHNFSPLAAIALFGGASLMDRRLAAIFPLTVMFVSDLFLGLHWTMPFGYACILFNVWMGSKLGSRMRVPQIVGASLLGSCVFFVVTNFGFWLMYQPWTWNALVESYVMAIPFFQNTVAGDLCYGFALFGALAFAQSRIPALQPNTAPAATTVIA